MKTTILKTTLAVMLLLVLTVLLSSCVARHARCMKNYYRDIEMGIAH